MRDLNYKFSECRKGHRIGEFGDSHMTVKSPKEIEFKSTKKEHFDCIGKEANYFIKTKTVKPYFLFPTR